MISSTEHSYSTFDSPTFFMYSGDSVPGLDNQQIPAFITDLYNTIPIINAALNVECCDLIPFAVICARSMPRKASPCPLFLPRRKWVGPPTLQRETLVP
jgi:hypothetical protein